MGMSVRERTPAKCSSLDVSMNVSGVYLHGLSCFAERPDDRPDDSQWQNRSGWQEYVEGGHARGSEQSWNAYGSAEHKPQASPPPEPVSKAQKEIDALWDKDPAAEQRERERASQQRERERSSLRPPARDPLARLEEGHSPGPSWSRKSPPRRLSRDDSEPRPIASQLADSIEQEQEEQIMRQQKGFPSPRAKMVTGKSTAEF